MNLKTELNDKQIKAVQTTEGPLLIIAGAGSGKTRTITYRIANMLSAGIPQSSILALTFTNKAAREMSNRIHQLTGKKLLTLTIATFHAFGVKILRSQIHHLKYKFNFSIYDQVDKVSLIKEIARELSSFGENVDTFKLSNLFSAIKTGRVEWNGSNDRYRQLYEEYQVHLKIFNAVDFDDLIILPIQLFEKFPEVLAEYQERYRYIMVDEFQDTSLMQYKLIKLIAEKYRNVCVVGDDDQSIYSWRGANFKNILYFEKDFSERIEIKMEQNYRSTKTILQAANNLIANNKNRKEKALWTGIEGGKPIDLFYPENEIKEAQFIAETVKMLKIRERIKYDQIGVLVRTNSLTRTIEEVFLAGLIPYKVSGGISFFQRKEVKDIIAYLRVLTNPDDDVNFLRIINTPRRGIGKKTVIQIKAAAEQKACSFYSAVAALCYAADSPLPDKIKKDLEDFLMQIEQYRNKILSGKQMAVTTRSLVETIDYWGYLILEYQKNERAARYKFGNVNTFIDMLERWESDPENLDPNIFTYLNMISLITRDEVTEDEETGKLNLMTIHSAKGLEFEIVFLAGVEENIIPHARSLEEDENNLEEERRLFYVAITRAKVKLFITACKTRRLMRDVVDCLPSPFLSELPEELIEFHKEEVEVETGEASAFFARMKERFN
ncbi:MAG: UvrD-helicase domain-containing protein [Spirochaetota bacterium]